MRKSGTNIPTKNIDYPKPPKHDIHKKKHIYLHTKHTLEGFVVFGGNLIFHLVMALLPPRCHDQMVWLIQIPNSQVFCLTGHPKVGFCGHANNSVCKKNNSKTTVLGFCWVSLGFVWAVGSSRWV